jgi:hypothetical protein
MLNFPDEILLTENRRNDNALFYNNKINKNVNIAKNKILNNNKYNQYGQYDLYSQYEQYDQYDSNYLYDSKINTNLPISLNFAKKTIIPIKELFDMYLLDNNMRLFVTKDLHHWQVINIIGKLDMVDPKEIGYEIYADCILPIYLDFQDKFTLAN